MGRGVGPGAGVPNFVTSRRHESCACRVMTFCSRIAAASASNTCAERAMRKPGLRRCASSSSGSRGSKSLVSSRSPSSSGAWATAAAAPGPQPSQRSSSRDGWLSLIVAMPSKVRVARHTAPLVSRANAGSPPPRRSTPTVCSRSVGCRGRQLRASSAITAQVCRTRLTAVRSCETDAPAQARSKMRPCTSVGVMRTQRSFSSGAHGVTPSFSAW